MCDIGVVVLAYLLPKQMTRVRILDVAFYKNIYIYIKVCGGVAQLEERVLCKHEAPRSKLGISIYIYI